VTSMVEASARVWKFLAAHADQKSSWLTKRYKRRILNSATLHSAPYWTVTDTVTTCDCPVVVPVAVTVTA